MSMKRLVNVHCHKKYIPYIHRLMKHSQTNHATIKLQNICKFDQLWKCVKSCQTWKLIKMTNILMWLIEMTHQLACILQMVKVMYEWIKILNSNYRWIVLPSTKPDQVQIRINQHLIQIIDPSWWQSVQLPSSLFIRSLFASSFWSNSLIYHPWWILFFLDPFVTLCIIQVVNLLLFVFLFPFHQDVRKPTLPQLLEMISYLFIGGNMPIYEKKQDPVAFLVSSWYWTLLLCLV